MATAESFGVAAFDSVAGDTDRVIANFQTAVSTGDAQQIVVQLGALEAYFHRLYDAYDQVDRLASRVDERVMRAQDHLLSKLAGHSGAKRIDGVEAALQTSMHIATRNNDGLSESLGSVRRLLRKNLADLYDAYAAYIKSDDDAANQLTAAGQPLGGLTL